MEMKRSNSRESGEKEIKNKSKTRRAKRANLDDLDASKTSNVNVEMKISNNLQNMRKKKGLSNLTE